MKVFVYEYICGGGLAGRPLPESFAREGWAMLASIVEDFSQVEGCEVVTTLDERFAGRPIAARIVERLSGDAETERRTIERLAAECEGTLLIAPEFDGILFDRVTWAERAGGRLLGSSSQGVAAAADKFACGQLLERAGVPAVVGQLVRLNERPLPSLTVPFPAVLKPRDGAGSQHSFLVSDPASLDALVCDLESNGIASEFLLQPFVPGMSVSVSFLIGPNCRQPLLAGQQILSSDGRFQYLGGRLPLPPDESRRAVAVATRAVAAMPGLNGFVGVDLVLGSYRPELQIENCKLKIANLKLQVSNQDRKSTRLNSSHSRASRMPSSA